MSDRLSDSSWFPQPPPKPLKATSAATLLFACVIFAVAVAGAVFWLTDNQSGKKAEPVAAAAAAVTASPGVQGTRQAFADCMRSMGAGSGFQGRGRFSRGPSKNYRDAFAVCRSLVQPQQSGPVSPPRTGTAPAPVA